MGYSCDLAEDGLVAVEKASRKRYDLILCVLALSLLSLLSRLELTPGRSCSMDLNMPRMDGLTATAEILKLMPDPDHRCVCARASLAALPR